MNVTATILVTIPAGTTGMYGADQDGHHWTTFELWSARPVTTPCGICGVAIRSGWIRGPVDGASLRVCAEHVEVA